MHAGRRRDFNLKAITKQDDGRPIRDCLCLHQASSGRDSGSARSLNEHWVQRRLQHIARKTLHEWMGTGHRVLTFHESPVKANTVLRRRLAIGRESRVDKLMYGWRSIGMDHQSER